MPHTPTTFRYLIAAIAVMATVAACSPGTAATLSHTQLAAPTPSASTTQTPTPSPTPPASPTAKPVATGTQVAVPSGPIKCTGGHITLNRSTAGGTGPFGSMFSTGTTAVALTFDDGPDPVNTPKILDLLKECGVHATFCLVGFRVRANPALVQRIYAEGHTLCNHSWQHLNLSHPPATTASGAPYTIVNDLQATNNAIHKAVPGAPIKYFRAPYGAWTQDVINAAKSLGMTPLDWSVDPRDWDSATFGTGASMVNHIISVVEGSVRPGSIVLSHDNGHPDTITAYRTLLPWLKARFTLIALSTAQP